jgi:hypothetical protein
MSGTEHRPLLPPVVSHQHRIRSWRLLTASQVALSAWAELNCYLWLRKAAKLTASTSLDGTLVVWVLGICSYSGTLTFLPLPGLGFAGMWLDSERLPSVVQASPHAGWHGT